MTTLSKFLKKHTPVLDTFLSKGTKIPASGPQIIRFVDEVLDEWEEISAEVTSKLERVEMTFWYCLYKLEFLAELDPELPLHPFEQYTVKQALELRPLLSLGKPLPIIYYATRPGYTYDEADDLDPHFTISAEQIH